MNAQGLYDPQHEHDACGVGFVVDIKGRKSHAIVRQALQVLKNLQHRGACGCEVNTGDGAGILVQMPDAFLRKVAGVPLPPAGQYGCGVVFFPRQADRRKVFENLIARIVAEEGQQLLGWRDVPSNDTPVGPSAVAVEPVFRQVKYQEIPVRSYTTRAGLREAVEGGFDSYRRGLRSRSERKLRPAA